MTQKFKPITNTASLEDVKKLFDAWRQYRTARKPIPSRLWQAAANLSPRYHLSEIAKALRLNYSELKKRIPAEVASLPTEYPTFIELDLGSPVTVSESIIEMEADDGRKMKIHLKGCQGLDLHKLCIDFWRNPK